MSKIKYSIEELKEQGLEVALFNKVGKLLATADGQFFLDNNAANFHAKKNGYEVHILDYPESSEESVPAEKTVKKTVEERIETILNTGDIAEIENLLKGEQSVKVKEAAAARIEEIKAAQNADPRQ